MRSHAIAEALALARQGRADAAITLLHRLVQREPRNAEATHTLGMLQAGAGDPIRAEYFLRRAAALAPGEPRYAGNLANVLAGAGRHADAIAEYRRALDVRPDYAPAWIGLSAALLSLGRPDESANAAAEAIRLAPTLADARVNHAMALMHSARADQAVVVLREAVETIPGSPDLLSLLAFIGNGVPGVSHEESFAAHVAAGAAHAGGISAHPPLFANVPDPDRRLRVAYLSPDFGEHAVARFIESAITHHDRSAVEVVCACTAPVAGPTADRLRKAADIWLDVTGLSDGALAGRLRAASIDVLVELSGHSAGHRLGAVARRPAPVIFTYIGYPNTTGAPTIGHRIVDAHTDPPGSDAFATERLVRLDRCFLCYTPPIDAPEHSPRSAGPITFGSFNALGKVNSQVLDTWARILASVPDSRLILKPVPDEPGVRARLTAPFVAHGIDPSRIEFVGYVSSRADHLGLYDRVHIALDTFPYNGTTTTCEALWMGVPVVTLTGDRHAARVGVSLLNAAALPEFIAPSIDSYIRIAADLARDQGRLNTLHSTLRERVRASPLCDAHAHGRALESAYREAWRAWCTGH